MIIRNVHHSYLRTPAPYFYLDDASEISIVDLDRLDRLDWGGLGRGGRGGRGEISANLKKGIHYLWALLLGWGWDVRQNGGFLLLFGT